MNEATEADLDRDLGADLALLAACKPDCGWCENPGLHVMEWDGQKWGVFTDCNDMLAVVQDEALSGCYAEPYARMFAASYDGWPAAIRRALAAEAELAKLKGGGG